MTVKGWVYEQDMYRSKKAAINNADIDGRFDKPIHVMQVSPDAVVLEGTAYGQDGYNSACISLGSIPANLEGKKVRVIIEEVRG